MAVRTLDEHEITVYKAIRLRALATNPEAFGSNHARESAFDDDTWRTRLRGFDGRPGVVMIDEIDEIDDSVVAGTAGVSRTERADEAIVWGMWVDPDHRRRGVASRLLTAAIDWARDHDHVSVMLHVMDGNNAAHRLYIGAGFVESGRSDAGELVLRRDLLG